MNNYRRFTILTAIFGLVLIIICNAIYILNNSNSSYKYYAVEVSRVTQELRNSVKGKDAGGNVQDKNIPYTDLSEYHYITGISRYYPGEVCNNEYVVENIEGTLYRIEYKHGEDNGALIYMNIAAGAMLLFTIFVTAYIGKKIIRPFNKMNELTCELARGNLSVPVKEEKSRYMGKFLWGMDMLRETLEESKEKELELQKEKKELILSISHDIKTPLAAIELYSRALAEGIYESSDKRKEALSGISRNTKEIKKYVDDIIIASRKDFINMEVGVSEFYLSEIITNIEKYYREKLTVTHTQFTIEKITDCLVKGDCDRATEVLQNVIENAIKYGDGRQIMVSFDEEEDCKIIIVENTGNTLKHDDLNNIFDSFYRGSNSHNVKGSGLGLYICRNLMRRMDGEIYAEIDNDIFRACIVIRKA